jgi:hypothetical protein
LACRARNYANHAVYIYGPKPSICEQLLLICFNK